jgi:hypothetical protein
MKIYHSRLCTLFEYLFQTIQILSYVYETLIFEFHAHTKKNERNLSTVT